MSLYRPHPHFPIHSTCDNASSPSFSPISPFFESDYEASSDLSFTPLSTPPSSPSMDCRRQTLFRLLPACSIPSRIKRGAWISLTLEVVGEFGKFQYGGNQSSPFRINEGQSLMPLECCLLYESKGQIINQFAQSHVLLEKRALQSANWLGMEDLSGPGIGPAGRGGLEVRVVPRRECPEPFWISVGCKDDQGLMPLVLGPFNYTAGSFQSYDSNRVLRPISIPQGNGSNPRIMLLEETWNNVPQGRVWDSAFILKDIFTKQVQDRLEGSRPPIFAGKRILDLSAGTGLLGVFLAGLAQVEMDLLLLRGRPNATNRDGITNSSTTHISNAPPSTTVVLTDLEDAMELIQRNIASNKRRIAPNVSIEAKPLIWGSSPLTRLKADPFDVVIASDVVYQVDSFNSLLETLYDLCTPGHTTLYLGYKWRALDIDMERQFFEKLSAMFSVEKSLHDLEVQVWCLKR